MLVKELMESKGYTVDHHCYPNYTYKDYRGIGFTVPTELEYNLYSYIYDNRDHDEAYDKCQMFRKEYPKFFELFF